MLSKSTVIGIAIAVLLAAIAAVRVLEWRGKQPVDAEQAESMSQQTELNVRIMQDDLSDRINEGPLAAQERMQSPTGLALFHTCMEWTDLNENHPSDENRENRDRACQRYRDYVDSGELE